MIFKRRSIAAAALVIAGGTFAFAGGHSASPTDVAVKARKAHMTLYSFNLTALGNMAQEKVPYDADAASAAAASLAALATMDQRGYWLAETSTLDRDDTNALPDLWDNLEDVISISNDLATASAALAGEAGNGLDALRAGLGAVGKTCGACHKPYRQSE